MHILDLQKLTDEKWINLFAARFENKGHTGRWVFASRRAAPSAPDAGGDAVIIVPVLRETGRAPRLVLIKEFRVPAGGYVYGLPAGLLEKGEAPEECARRELFEETGLAVTAVKKVSPPAFSSSGLTDESAYLVFVDAIATPDATQKLEPSEEIEPQLFDYAAACQLCDDPAARIDAKLWTVLYMYQQMGKIA